MSLKRDYWKWKIGAGRRGTLRRAARRTGNGFEVMGACVALLDHARRESHWVDNAEGAFTTSIADLAIDYSTPTHRVRETLGALIATGWLSASPDVAVVDEDDDVTLRVTKYLDFNYPQGSDADRKQAQRLREADDARDEALGKTANVQGVVTGCHEVSVVSHEVTKRPSCHEVSVVSPEEKREEEREETISSPTEVDDHPNSRPKDPTRDIARTLFAEWLEATSRNPNQNRLSDKRIGMVRARLRDGYTQSQLSEAIRGIAGSAWHAGQNPNGTRYDTFEFVMRSGENVEKGCEFAAAAANQQAVRETGMDVEATLRWYRDTLGYTDDQLAEARRQMTEGAA